MATHEGAPKDMPMDREEKYQPPKKEDPRQPGDDVNHPTHYRQGSTEAIDILEMADEHFRCSKLWASLKYMLRHRHKGNPIKDLKKARWYLDRKIKRMEEGKE